MLSTLLFYLIFLIALYWLRRLFPYHQPDNYTPLNSLILKKYSRWDKVAGWLTLAFFTMSMLIICGPLFDYRNSNLQDKAAIFIVLPSRFDWIIITWLPVFGLSPFFHILASKLYLGDDFRNYVGYSNQKIKYNAYKAVIPMCSVFAVAGIILSCFLWNYSLYAYNDKIVVRWFLSTKAKVYRYNQIKSIDFIPETRKQGAVYEVTFTDGLDWNTLTGLHDPNDKRDIYFIWKRSKVNIDTLFAASD